MNEEELKYFQEMQEKQKGLLANVEREQLTQNQKNLYEQQQNVGMVKEQLDLTEDLKRMENLLRGRYKGTNEIGEVVWLEPKNDTNLILTEEGVQFILNSIAWYMNKNTLLSNFDEDTIFAKMEDYATSLADALFMRSEMYFRKPSMKECEELLQNRITLKIEHRKAKANIQGISFDEVKERKKILDLMDIGKQLEEISAYLKKDKFKMFEHTLRVVQDAVHSTYNRAWKGMERTSLRKSMHESLTPVNALPKLTPQKRGFFKRH